MNLNLSKYLLFFLVLTACEKEQNNEKNYGHSQEDPKSLNVSIDLSEFKRYGEFIERIRSITCSDSIPKIIIEKKNQTKNIYPNEICNPPPFNPEGKHYVSFRKGEFYDWKSNMKIKPKSLKKKFEEDFLYHRKSNNYKAYFIIIESERDEKMNGIEEFIVNLTQEYDKLETDIELSLAFWEVVPPLPPPPIN